MKALLIVDVQNDFCPGGALATPHGDKIIPVINKLMNKFPHVYASKDWHPTETVHFEKWPPHCVMNTPGAELHPDLNKEKIHVTLLKGTGGVDNGYSAFEASNLSFEEDLRQKGIDELYITGLTTEYCVQNSVVDAIKKGFKVYVVEDAVEGVREQEGDVEKALEAMKNAGARIVRSSQLEKADAVKN